MTLYIILPVRNRKSITQAILAQLSAQQQRLGDRLRVQIIVVDDGSTDGTGELIQSQFPNVCLLSEDGSLWWTGAIVRGMGYALDQFSPDYLLWLNDDITVSDDFLQTLGQICLESQDDAILGGVILASNYPGLIAYGGVISGQVVRNLTDFGDQETLAVDALNGNLVLIPSRVVAAIGLPDAQRFPHYGGDYEYFCRAKRQGFPILLTRTLTATVNFTPADVVRYMPVWMQWYLASSFHNKFQIIRGLTSLKSNYNIWHMVNSMYRDQARVPAWQYWLFYLRKLGQIAWASVTTKQTLEQKIRDYLREQKIPPPLAQQVVQPVVQPVFQEG